MQILKRTMAILLVLCFIALTLIGCAKKQTSSDKQNGATNAPSGSVDDEQTQRPTNEYGEESFTNFVPVDDLDFEEEELTILLRDTKISSREWTKESPEDELDEAVAMRNAAVEDALNLVIDYEFVAYANYDAFASEFNNMILQDIKDQYHYYDIAANFAYCGAYTIVRDCASNLLDVEAFPFFNFDLPCWNQAIVKNTTINGRLHYVSGDVNLTLFDAALVIWYNKTLYDEYAEPTDPENIQLLALEGKWTYDELYRWADRLYADSNGTQGRQADDTYGLSLARYSHTMDSLPYAWDLEFLINNPDGTHEFNILGNNKAEEAFTKVNDLIETNGNWQSPSVGNFAAGCYVFWPATIYPSEDANMTIREMNDKYGLLPMPKYTPDQEQYGTTTQDFYTLMTVLDHSESPVTTKGKAISAYLQFMTEESYTSVRGYYFNRIIKPKYFGTDDSEGTVSNSIALFDIIVDNIEFEYWTVYSAQLNNIAWLWRDSFRDFVPSLEAGFKAKADAYDAAIKSTDAWLGLRDAE